MSLPPRPTVLAGREDLLALVHGQLTAGDLARMVVLCGMGGVGKTSLAAEYAHRYLAEVGIAWQIPSGDAAVADQSMAELAAQAGGRDLVDPRDPVASVRAVLAAYPADWLLIFDNAVDEMSVRRFLPPGLLRPGADHQPEPALGRCPGAARAGARCGRGGPVPGRPGR